MIRVLLVDDQPLVRQGWRMRLALESDIVVVGEAGNGAEALALVDTLRPDVVIMDVEMPVVDGIVATAQLKGRGRVAVVVLSIRDDTEIRARSLEAGAVAFVSKQEPFARLLRAVRKAAGELDR
jgi:DNA-binding NarL/FixJ family response regulator